MKVSSKFKIDNFNNIIVEDTTVYPQTQDWTLKSYRKEDSGSVFVLGYHSKDKDIEYISTLYVNLNTDNSQHKIQIPKDGWITLHQIVLPTKEFVDQNFDNIKDSKQYIFYIHKNKLYQKSKEGNEDSRVNIETIMSLDSEWHNTCDNEIEYISIWNLQKCLVNLCLEIFNNLGAFGKCFNSSSINDELKYKRDLVWMAIHVVKYLAKHNMKAEAARIINQIEGCNGICTQTKSTRVSGCGCNK